MLLVIGRSYSTIDYYHNTIDNNLNENHVLQKLYLLK